MKNIFQNHDRKINISGKKDDASKNCHTQNTIITLFDFNEKAFIEKKLDSVEECREYKHKGTISWINIDGLNDSRVIEDLGAIFELHPLTIEDILDIGQRPKIEDLGKYIFLSVKMLYEDGSEETVAVEHVGIVVGRDFVLSFQEKYGDVFEPIRERIRTNKGRIRTAGADYLGYRLLDAIIDNYFSVLEKLGERVETLEDELLEDPSPRTSAKIHALKRETIILRKSIWPLREVVAGIGRSESNLVEKTTAPYLKDLYDHTIQVMDTLETLREILSGMLDTYLSSLSNKMNEVMKLLTIIGTIFIPLTFIAGVYGMNFRFMPELEWKFGYPLALGIMAVVAIAMIFRFKKKGLL